MLVGPTSRPDGSKTSQALAISGTMNSQSQANELVDELKFKLGKGMCSRFIGPMKIGTFLDKLAPPKHGKRSSGVPYLEKLFDCPTEGNKTLFMTHL